MKIANRINRKRKGFTLIELLIVILILAILMAVALPLYLAAVGDSQKKTCRANMQTIANAAQAYKVRSTTHAYPTAIGDMVGAGQDLPAAPKCPSNSGDYTLSTDTSGNLTITCPGGASSPGHGTFTPGSDSE